MARKVFVGILYISLSICLFGGAIGSAIYNLGSAIDASSSSSWLSDFGYFDNAWQSSNDSGWWDSGSDSGSWGSWDSGSDSGSWGDWDSGSDSGSWDSDW